MDEKDIVLDELREAAEKLGLLLKEKEEEEKVGKKKDKVTNVDLEKPSGAEDDSEDEDDEANEGFNAIFQGQELSEEFKTKAFALFEAAVATKALKLQKITEARLEEEMKQKYESLVENVDGYLDLVVDQWIENNEIALERGIKGEMFESFISGMKNLIVEHNVELPEDDRVLVENLQENAKALQAQLDALQEQNESLQNLIQENNRIEAVNNAAEGMSDLDRAKFFTLANELVYESQEKFVEKLEIVKENFFSKKVAIGTNQDVEPKKVEEVKPEIDTRMAAYVSAIR